MEMAMVDAVLKSSMGRMRRRSRMCMKQERERLEMWLENERRGSKVTPRLRTGASEMKVVEEEVLDSRMEESGDFLIWAGRPIRMNFKRAVCISCRRHPQVGGRPAHVDACGQGEGVKTLIFCGRHKWMTPMSACLTLWILTLTLCLSNL